MNSDNFIPLVIAGILCVVGIGAIASSLDGTMAERQQAVTDLAHDQAAIEFEAQRQAIESKLAEQRYGARCVLIPRQLTAGMAFPNLPPKTPVCDATGFTAVVDGVGVIQNIAFTPNQDAITRRTSNP